MEHIPSPSLSANSRRASRLLFEHDDETPSHLTLLLSIATSQKAKDSSGILFLELPVIMQNSADFPRETSIQSRHGRQI